MESTAKKSGFTLIELLIVVAIIAILAAIAVPNFLEAQTRAKVTRAKADHRTIATALESYFVDNNKYPPQASTPPGSPYPNNPLAVWGGEGIASNGSPYVNDRPIAWVLSSPIAYLSSTQAVFRDPFFAGIGKNGTSIVNDTKYYNYSGDYVGGRIYDAAQDGSVAQFEATSAALRQVSGWHLRSRGPDSDYERRIDGWADLIRYRGTPGTGTTGNGGIGAVYDPTNGTKSSGDISRFGKGKNYSLQ
ncbi:prepilin-type N-terminal cleavage/methylation domain-containing protein [Candidatus Sumerlaeota bacterium]|nr:prepilin-type N-terminal cleavage/methylation domain-containing protein [Candidatus Sumerlaeota bacterium]